MSLDTNVEPSPSPMPKTNAEMYLDFLTATFGQENTILQEKADDGGPPIAVFVYEGCPEPGMITGITYGLSARAYAGWTLSRPEMVISMESTSRSWPSAALGLTSYFASKKRFCYGDIFTVDGSLADDSEMDAALIFAQSLLDPADATLEVDGYKIHLSQYYPIYRSEIGLYDRIGLKEFWHHPKFGIYNPKRPRIE